MKIENRVYRMAVDFDSVLAETMGLWITELNRRRGTNFQKDDVVSFDLIQCFGIAEYERSELFDYIWDDDNWKKIPPTEDFLSEKIQALRKHGKVDILTAIPENQVENTKKWLARNEISYDDYIIVPNGLKKSDYEYDIFIDDSPSNAEQIANCGKTVFLYDQPWNQKMNSSEKIRRIHSISEVIDYLDRIRTT
jgi:hypothetical protein